MSVSKSAFLNQKFILEKSGRDRKSVIEGELSKIESAKRESENSSWEILNNEAF